MNIYAFCLDCGQSTLYAPTLLNCPACQGQWLEAHYDYSSVASLWKQGLSNRAFNLFRYRELLPILEYNPDLSLGEGGTPLVRAVNLGLMLGLPNIYIKDERQGPTGSFKDRQAAVNIAALKEAGITEIALASTGNVAMAYSAYAARAGIKLWAFLTSLVPAEKMRETALYGTQVIKVTASYDQAKKVAAEYARQRNLYLERGSRSIPSVEAMKTIAFEISEQLAQIATASNLNRDDEQARFRAPDWYFQAISGGLGPLGVQKGFRELYQMGLIDHVPAIGGVQTDGCAPMAHAWRAGKDTVEPVTNPRTHIATLSTGDPGRTYTLLRQRMMAHSQKDETIGVAGEPGTGPWVNGGIFESVSDEETFRTMHILAKMEGLSVEPAAAVAVAGVIKLARAGVLRPEQTIVINCSGHTIPIERTILGEGWARNVVLSSQAAADTPQEGLLAALSKVTVDRFPNVLIVDDTEDARRLIRRILQAQGNYSIHEAANGRQAIELARQHLPDLIILDLMMPEMDGFAVLDSLKADASTAPIPIIVVTAKELTVDEMERLHGQVHSLMQKGEFMSDDLQSQVKDVIK